MQTEETKLERYQDNSIHAWIQFNKIKTEMGGKLDFDSHPYLKAIYADDSKYLCCLKAAQIGFSTMAIYKTLWLARNKHIDCGYILPTVDMVQKFVGSKVNRMIQQNPVLQKWVKDKDSITQKQIDENYIHYLGAMTDRSAIMLSLDMLVADEYDKSPQDILEIYDSRLQHSKFGYKWIFSNPTAPGFGVDRFYQQSDKKQWNIHHSCGRIYPMDEKCLNYENEKYECPFCHELITDEERKNGDWYDSDGNLWDGEIKIKDVEWSGWAIPVWINPFISAKYVCHEKKNKSAEYFANMVAGLPFVGSGNAVSAQTITKNLNSNVNDQDGRIIIGVDTGLPNYGVIGNKDGIFYYGSMTYEDIEGYLKRWTQSVLVFDAQGDLSKPRELKEKYPGRVFLCFLRNDRKTDTIITWGEDDKYGEVTIDRNKFLQMVIDELVDKRITFNGTEGEWQEYITHWLNIYRVWQEDSLGIPRFKWERSGPDHLVFATVFWRVGMDKYGQGLAQIIKKSDVRTVPRVNPEFNIKSFYGQKRNDGDLSNF